MDPDDRRLGMLDRSLEAKRASLRRGPDERIETCRRDSACEVPRAASCPCLTGSRSEARTDQRRVPAGASATTPRHEVGGPSSR